jgi:hypothetical protein
MKLKSLSQWLLTIAAIATFTACEKTDDTIDSNTKKLKGLFVVCEGGVSNANGDITWYSPDSVKTIQSLYHTVNGTPLGSIFQSFATADTLGFLVVNNSQKLTVVNMNNFKSIKTIENLSYPRCIIQVDANTMYLTNGNGSSNNHIYVLDIPTLSIVDTIKVGKGPESLIKVNNKVYVCNSGGWSTDNNVMEININTRKVKDTITVAYSPLDIEVDYNDNLWIYCNGGYDSNYNPLETAKIYNINTSTNKVIGYYDYEGAAKSYGNYLITMSKDKKSLYFINDAIYKLDITQTTLSASKWVDGSYYAVSTDPDNGDILGLDATNKKAIAYDSNTKTVKYEIETGTSPNAVVFYR